jgi:hypothetical protein
MTPKPQARSKIPGRAANPRKLWATVLLASIALHGIAAVVAGTWIIVKRLVAPAEPPPSLQALKSPKPPPSVKEQRMQAAAFEGALAKAALPPLIQSNRAAFLSLPSLPKLPLPDLPALQSGSLSKAALAESAANCLSAATGSGGGSGAGGGGAGGGGNAISFLGIQTQAKRIVLMYDVSKTVAAAAEKAGMPMERIRDETARLISGLGANTRFGLVEFARNYAFFKPELLPSSTVNRTAALAWLDQHFATSGTLPRSVPGLVSGSPGFLAALEHVFKMQPDSVFVISDANMQRGTGSGSAATIPVQEIGNTLARLQSGLPRKARVFFIGVGVPREKEKDLRRILSDSGGAYSELKR